MHRWFTIQLPGRTGRIRGPLRRLVIILVIASMIIFGVVYFAGFENVSESRLWGIPAMNSTPGGARQRESEHYQETVREANDMNLQIAGQEGHSHLPIPETIPEARETESSSGTLPWMNNSEPGPDGSQLQAESKNDPGVLDGGVQTTAGIAIADDENAAISGSFLDRVLGTLAAGPDQTPEMSDAEKNDVALTNPDGAFDLDQPDISTSHSAGMHSIIPTDSEKTRNYHDAMLAQMSSIAGGMTIGPMAGKTLITTTTRGSQAGKQSRDPEAEQNIGNLNQVHAGQILYGSIVLATDSDNNLPVIAQVDTGEFKGYRLVGGFDIAGNSDGLIMSFDRVVDLEGQEYSTSAIAVDGISGDGPVVSHIDQRILARYGPIMASAFISGLAQSASAPRTVMLNSFGNQTVIQEEATMNKSIYAGISAASAQLQEDLSRSIPRGPRIIVNAGHPIGILFLESVGFRNFERL